MITDDAYDTDHFQKQVLHLWDGAKKDCVEHNTMQPFVLFFNRDSNNNVYAGYLELTDTQSLIQQAKPVAERIQPFAAFYVAEGYFDETYQVVPVTKNSPETEKENTECLFGILEAENGITYMISAIERTDGKKTVTKERVVRPQVASGLFTSFLSMKSGAWH